MQQEKNEVSPEVLDLKVRGKKRLTDEEAELLLKSISIIEAEAIKLNALGITTDFKVKIKCS